MGNFSYEQDLATYRASRTFVKKSGSVPGYSSIIVIGPEYDIGIIILMARSHQRSLGEFRKAITVSLVRDLEELGSVSLKKDMLDDIPLATEV